MSKSKLYLTPTDDGMELTREEYAEADVKAPWRYERHDGRLVVMSPAGYEHRSTAEPFRDHLVAYKLIHPDLIQHVFQDGWAYVEESTDRIPDIAVYLHGKEGRMPERAPDMVFEIVSEATKDRRRDYEEKREEYERIGVSEYVIVDRFDHRLTVLTLNDGVYSENILGADDVYASQLLPGLEIPLKGII